MRRVIFRSVPKLDYGTTESINTLCTNITFCGSDTKAILLTSCREHEGKSSITLSAWRTLASMGYSTVLIDADLRRSLLSSRYGIQYPDGKEGLSHYLSRDKIGIKDIVYQTNMKDAFFVPCGHDVANSITLLSNTRFGELIRELKEEFDYILIDTPPIGAIVDAASVAKWCDGALLVVTQNGVKNQEVLYAKEQIEKSNCPVIGAILNKVKMDRTSSRYYNRAYYAAYYSNYYSKRERNDG